MRIGLDVAAVDEIETALRRWGRRYSGRLYTEAEMAASEQAPSAAACLAAAFAVKEAVIKVLDPPDDHGPVWTSVELSGLQGSAPRVRLSGPALSLARRAGLQVWKVAVSRSGGTVMAVVLATPAP